MTNAMRLHILGCGDAFGSGGRNHSGYLVEAYDRMFLLDCGPTTLLAMKRAGLDPQRLDVVFLSHLHGDHFAGLPFLFIEYLYEKPRRRPLQVAGPPGTEKRVRQLFALMYGTGSSARSLPPTRFHVLEPKRRKVIQGVSVFPFRVPHQEREVSLALKVGYRGKQILFSGDSAWTELFVTHASGTDLFLCECSFYDRNTSNHMSYRSLRDHLSKVKCRRIVLTHLGEEVLSLGKKIPFTLAQDGMIIKI
jgi:ribonuclease BN (tRNA processing enzyme)